MAGDTQAAYDRLKQALQTATAQVDALGPDPQLDRDKVQSLRQAIRDVNTAAREYGQAAIGQRRLGGRFGGLFGR